MENQQIEKKEKRLSQKLTTLSLVLIIFTIPLALLLDFIAMKDAILQFVGTIVIGSIAFVVLFVLFVASFILIFGFYLVKEHGFWPLSLGVQFFKEMFADITITNEQLQLFIYLRIIIVVLSVGLIVMSSISKYLVEKDIKEGYMQKVVSPLGQAKAALALSIIGLLVSIGSMIIASSLIT